MMFSLDDAYLFAKVVEQGGFTAAARATGQPKSTFSKRVGVLERQLGLRLLHRNSRSLSLTEAGVDFYRHICAMLIEAEAAEASMQGRLVVPQGNVRLTASVITSRYHLAPILPAIAEAFPEIRIMLHASDRTVDIVQEAFDLAIRDHHGPLPASELVQRRIGFEPDFLVASPSYLEHAGAPAMPAEIAHHDGLLSGAIARPALWQITRINRDGPVHAVMPRLRAFADDPATLESMTLAGFGIAALPRCICAPYIVTGALLRVLPDWIAGGATTTILVPQRRGQLPAVRVVADALFLQLGRRLEG